MKCESQKPFQQPKLLAIVEPNISREKKSAVMSFTRENSKIQRVSLHDVTLTAGEAPPFQGGGCKLTGTVCNTLHLHPAGNSRHHGY